jgi:stage V sporulation protein B
MNNAAKGAVYLSASAFLFMLSGYIANIWLGRHFGPQTYGKYGVVIVLLSLINITQTSGLPQSLAKFTAEKPNTKDSILRSALNIQFTSTICIAILFALAAPLLAKLLNDSSLAPYIRLSALVFPFYGIYSIYVGYYNGLHNYKRQAVLNSVYAIAKVIGIIVLSLFFKLYGAIAAFILAPIFALLFGLHIPTKTKNKYSHKKLIAFSLPIIIFSVLITLYLSIDLLFVKAHLQDNDAAAGYYIAAQNISLILYFCMSAASSVILPSISHNIAKGLDTKTTKLINNSLRYMLIVLAPAAALMAATSTQLIKVIYSSEYIAASSPLQILLVAYVFLAIFVLFSNILNGGGSIYSPIKSSLPGLLVTVLMCIVLIPKYGLIGAAIATFAGTGISVLIAAWYVRIKFNLHFPVISIIRILGLSIAIYIFANWFNASLWQLPFMYLFFAAIYLLLLGAIKEITTEEKIQFQSIMPDWLPFIRWL